MKASTEKEIAVKGTNKQVKLFGTGDKKDERKKKDPGAGLLAGRQVLSRPVKSFSIFLSLPKNPLQLGERERVKPLQQIR